METDCVHRFAEGGATAADEQQLACSIEMHARSGDPLGPCPAQLRAPVEQLLERLKVTLLPCVWPCRNRAAVPAIPGCHELLAAYRYMLERPQHEVVVTVDLEGRVELSRSCDHLAREEHRDDAGVEPAQQAFDERRP